MAAREKAEHSRKFYFRADEKLAAIIEDAAREEQRAAGNLLLRIVSTWAVTRIPPAQPATH